ncbi:MAG: signal peptide peptidase SppA [Victivallales bacterium]|nr:signal peptide peptidase SppA [Victivallales bacterium]
MDPVNPPQTDRPSTDEPTPLRPEPSVSQAASPPSPAPHTPPPGYWQMMPPPRRGRGCLFYCFLLFVLASLAGFALFVATPLMAFLAVGQETMHELAKGSDGGAGFQEGYVPGSGPPGCSRKIALIGVKGVILSRSGRGFTNAGRIVAEIDQARLDRAVVAVILDLDTPGGEVTASDEIHRAVQRCRKRKPVVSCMRSLAASGGYYVAAGSDWIVANRHTLTGSIGVLINSLNYAELMTRLGLKMETIKSGEMKDILSGSRPRTESEHQYMQELVQEAFHEFAAIVAAGREGYADVDAVLAADFADGRILTGRAAKEAGLVDQLGYLDDAVDKARELAGGGSAKLIRYRHRVPLSKLLLGLDAEQVTPTALVPAELRAMRAGCLFAIWPRALTGGTE